MFETFKLDLAKSGLNLFYEPYEIAMMQLLWEGGEHNSLSVYKHLEKKGLNTSRGKGVSRASVINFLNRMCDEDILSFSEKTGKGGHQRIYVAKLTEKALWVSLAAAVERKLEEGAEG